MVILPMVEAIEQISTKREKLNIKTPDVKTGKTNRFVVLFVLFCFVVFSHRMDPENMMME